MKLSDKETEALAMVSEECGETVQIIGKILRHGLESYHPSDADMTPNRVLLKKEITDIMAVYSLLVTVGVITPVSETELLEAIQKKLLYAHYIGDS